MGIYTTFSWGQGSELVPLPSVSAASVTNGLATVTFSSNHGLTTGDVIDLDNVSADFNFGTHTVTVTSDTQVTFSLKSVLNGGPAANVSLTGLAGTAVKVIPGEFADDKTYGDRSRLGYSSEPFTATATDYDKVALKWVWPQQGPEGDFSYLRVVRSNDGYPETQEDGAIILDWSKPRGDTTVTFLEDSSSSATPLVSGKFAYYRIWVKKDTGVWAIAGDAYALVPARHDATASLEETFFETNREAINLTIGFSKPTLLGTYSSTFAVTFPYDLSTTLPNTSTFDVTLSSVAEFIAQVDSISLSSTTKNVLTFSVTSQIPFSSSTKLAVKYTQPSSGTKLRNDSDSLDVPTFFVQRDVAIRAPRTTLQTRHVQLADILPKVYTSVSASPLDEIDYDSPLFKFLDAFSFELDRILTYAELLLPLESGRLVSQEVLALQSLQLGVELEPYLATKQQRRLAREALYTYKNKGTVKGASAFIESMTGFAPDVSLSPNLVLTPQDSSFTKSVGFWKAQSGATITADNTVTGVSTSTEPLVSDSQWVGKVVASADSRISNGTDFPITRGTPVTPGQLYTFSGYSKAADSDIRLNGYAIWYDYKGREITVQPPRTYTQEAVTTTSAGWSRYALTGRAPGAILDTSSISIATVSGSKVATITFTGLNVFVTGNTVLLRGTTDQKYDGQYFVTGFGLNYITVLMPTQSEVATTAFSAKVIAANPAVTPVPALITDAAVTDTPTAGTASVTFNANHGLSTGDIIIIQGVNSKFDYGIHQVTKISDTVVAFLLLDFATGQPVANTTLTGLSGTAVKVTPTSGATPETPAKYAGFELVAKDAGTFYVDLVQMATYDVREYHEARSIEVFLNPAKSNYANNPSFDPRGIAAWNGKVASTAIKNYNDTGIGLPAGTGQTLEVTSLSASAVSSYTIATVSGNSIATITTSTNHGLSVGTTVFMSGDFASAGQLVLLTVPSLTSFTVQLPVLVTPVTNQTPVAPTGVIPVTQISTLAGLPISVPAVSYTATAPSLGVSQVTLTLASTHPFNASDMVYLQGTSVIKGARILTGVTTNTLTFLVSGIAEQSTPVALTDTLVTPTTQSVIDPLAGVILAPEGIPTNKFFTGSVYLKTDSSTPSAVTLSVTAAEVVGATQTILASHSESQLISNSWSRLSARVFVPNVIEQVLGSVRTNPVVLLFTISMASPGTKLYLNRAQIEDAFNPSDYFDGSFDPSYGVVWEKPAYASASHQYPNLAAKLVRLQQELPKYLTVGAPFLIKYYGGNVIKPLT